MRELIALIALCAFVPLADAQPQIPPPPQAPPVLIDDTKPAVIDLDARAYASAHQSAIDLKKPLVIFVGPSSFRGIRGAVCVQLDQFNQSATPRIIVGFPASAKTGNGWSLGPLATDQDILQVIGGEATPAPFSTSPKPSITVRPDDPGAKSFRSGSYHPGHNCPQCSATQTRISGAGPGGSHTHTCSRCATTWHHGGAAPQAPPNLTISERAVWWERNYPQFSGK